MPPDVVLEGPEPALDIASTLGIRPEDFRVVPAGDEALFVGRVTLWERLGEVTIAHVTLPSGVTLTAKLGGDVAVDRGDLIRLTATPGNVFRFDMAGLRIASGS